MLHFSQTAVRRLRCGCKSKETNDVVKISNTSDSQLAKQEYSGGGNVSYSSGGGVGSGEAGEDDCGVCE